MPVVSGDLWTCLAPASGLLSSFGGGVIGMAFCAGFLACRKVEPYLIPRALIEEMARDNFARLGGDGALTELAILANRARLRCETAEEVTHRRVARAVRRMRAGELATIGARDA
jgi:hypothetical protein